MAETKISRRILEALENGRFQYLPERVFSRNFVRQYTAFIGYHDERILEWFDEAWKRFELASGSFHPAEVEQVIGEWAAVAPAAGDTAFGIVVGLKAAASLSLHQCFALSKSLFFQFLALGDLFGL